MLNKTKQNKSNDKMAQQQLKHLTQFPLRKEALQLPFFLGTSGSCKQAQILSLQFSRQYAFLLSQGAQPSFVIAPFICLLNFKTAKDV